MGEVVDGEYQKYVVEPGAYIREHFFGKYPELLELVKNYSDEQLHGLRRGGHDPDKVYAAYKAAVEHQGSPTVILAKTVKGYGLGEAGEGRNVTHQQKKLNEEELRIFRDRFDIPISDEELAEAAFYRPPENSPEIQYLARAPAAPWAAPCRRGGCKHGAAGRPRGQGRLGRFFEGIGPRRLDDDGFVQMLTQLLKDKEIGK